MRDKSPQGFIDKDIILLLKLLNSLGYKTTSSCSGRIVLLKISKAGDKGKAEWLYKTHAKADYKEIFNLLKNEKIWFLQEPFILHVKCQNLNSAQRLLTIARNTGFKISGITSTKNYTVELRGTERIETVLYKNDEKYIKLLVEEANKKLKMTKEKIKRFYNALKNLS